MHITFQVPRIDKCATLVLKRGKITRYDGISLSDEKVMKGLIEGAGYKYLGVIKADQTRYMEMKEKVKIEYLRRVRKVLETKLNGGNIIKGINIWAVSLLVLCSIHKLESYRIDATRSKN